MYKRQQVDFVRGAHLSKGGRSIIAIASTAGGGKVSKIVPFLEMCIRDRRRYDRILCIPQAVE